MTAGRGGALMPPRRVAGRHRFELDVEDLQILRRHLIVDLTA
ncbi:hypothetical protein [Streptomyces sp. NPDC051677]